MAEEVQKKKKMKPITVKANKKGRHKMPMLSFLRVLMIPLIWLMLPFRFYGKRKVGDGAYVYVSNHYRLWDVAYPACTTWEGIHYMAKRSVVENWFLKGFCRSCKVIGVNRDGADIRAIMDAMKCLKNGEKIVIYPEGTRNRSEAEMLEFKAGAAMMAIKTKTPIVPICIYKKPRPFRMNAVLIGEPFELSEYYDRKLSEEELTAAEHKVRDVLLELRRKHTEFLESKKKKKVKSA